MQAMVPGAPPILPCRRSGSWHALAAALSSRRIPLTLHVLPS